MDLTITSPTKELWPGVTKADLADYYKAVADRLLTAIEGRPLTLKRHPDGTGRPGFFQKHLPDSAPSGLQRFTEYAAASKREVSYLVVTRPDHLRWLAQVAAVELHPMTCRVDRRDRPDQLILDLDPAEHGGPSVVRAAWWTREVLDDLGLAAHVKYTGKRGLHLVVPITRRYSFDEVRALSLSIARAVAARHADALTAQMRKADRGDRLLVDWSRGGSAQTVIAAWSPRVAPVFRVAVPLSWADLESGDWPPETSLTSAALLPDPWVRVAPQRLEKSIRAITRWGFPLENRSPRSRTD